jgi:hypothetical protein
MIAAAKVSPIIRLLTMRRRPMSRSVRAATAR